MTSPLRLRLDGAALLYNHRWLETRAGRPVTAVVKADGYRVGAREVARRLAAAGCRSFAVSNWREAAEVAPLVPDLIVLHGFRADDRALAARLPDVRPVLGSLAQYTAWREAFPGRAADLMVDTGINRLGIPMDALDAVRAAPVATVHSHFACADEPGHPMNAVQIARFAEVAAAFPAARHVLANTAGVALGPAAIFDGARVGLGLYGGRPVPAVETHPIVFPEAELLQVKRIPAGASVGYGATFTATRATEIGVLNLGYADGLPRMLGPALRFGHGGRSFPVVGRVSMDLITVDVTGAGLAAGAWLALDFDLARLEAHGPFSQYELLTALSPRYERVWT